MISKVAAYQASDGSFHAKLEDAQHQSLHSLFADLENAAGQAAVIATRILENRDRVLDILTTTRRSRPQRRKVNGAVMRPRAGKAAQAAAATTAA